MTQERLEGIKRFFANPELRIKTASQQAMVVGMGLELVKALEEGTPEVHLVHDRGGEWEGIYVRGELKGEGHSLTPQDVLRALGMKFNVVELSEGAEVKLSDRGSLPKMVKGVLG